MKPWKWIVFALAMGLILLINFGTWKYFEMQKEWHHSKEGVYAWNIGDDQRIAAGKFTELERQLIAKGMSPLDLKQDAYLRMAWEHAKMKKYNEMYENIDLAYATPVDGPNKRRGHLAETGMILWEQGKRDEAMKLWDRTFEANPNNYGKHAYVGMRLCCHPEAAQRDEKIGLTFAEKAYEIAPNERLAVCALAMALSASGRYDEAIKHEREALLIPWKPSNDAEKARPPYWADEKIEARIALYESGEPFRQKLVSAN